MEKASAVTTAEKTVACVLTRSPIWCVMRAGGEVGGMSVRAAARKDKAMKLDYRAIHKREADKLRAENDRLRAERDYLDGQCKALSMEAAAAIDERDRLRAALERYGCHLRTCGHIDDSGERILDCTCGLERALKGGE